MLRDSNPARSGRMMQALRRMGKLDAARLQRVYEGLPEAI